MICVRYCKSAAVAVFSMVLAGAAIAADASWHLEGGWVRAVPPNARTTAAYLDVVNHSDAAIEIRSARTEVSEKTEIHDMLHENGMMKMVQIPVLEVPAHGRVSLAPGGKHIMMLGLKEVPKEGTVLDVCLTDAIGVEQCSTLPVSRDAPKSSEKTGSHSSSSHSHHHH